jgi:transposase-like protein
MPKKYPPEFKRDVVAMARRGTIPIPEVAAYLDVSDSARHHIESLLHWRPRRKFRGLPSRELCAE